MKKTFAVAILAATLMMSSLPARAETDAMDVVLLPFRIVTGVGGMGLGAVAGGVQGIVYTEQKFAEHTFGQADENPMMLPLGLIGAAVAVPVGFVTGAPKGMVEWGQKGYEMWGE